MVSDKSYSAALVNLENQTKEFHPGHHHANHDKSSKRWHPMTSDLVELWDIPTELSSTSEGVNSAAHHALEAGLFFCLDVLEYFVCCFLDDSYHEGPKNATRLAIFTYFTHSSLNKNANEHIPSVMECIFGHSAIIKHVLEKCL